MVMVGNPAPLSGAKKKSQQPCCKSLKAEVVYSAENLESLKHKSCFYVHMTSTQSHGGGGGEVTDKLI